MTYTKKFISDEQWKKIEPLLPNRKPSKKGGRPPAPNRDSWKAYYGFYEQEPDGVICRPDIQALQPAGEG